MDEERRRKGLLGIIQGAADRWTKQRSRDEIVEQAIEDQDEPLAQRVVEPDACDHCQSLGDSEPVPPANVAREYHQYCKCHIALMFQGTRLGNRLLSDKALRRLGITMEDGADPDWFEKRDAIILASQGRKVEFLKRHPHGSRRADSLVDGELVEFKNPTSSGLFTVQNQILSCLYGKNKTLMKPQSDVLLISNARNSMTMLDMERSLAAAFDERSQLTAVEKAYMRKIILLDERTRMVRVYEIEDAGVARLNGPRRRQGNISIDKRRVQVAKKEVLKADDVTNYREFHRDVSIVESKVECSGVFDESWSLIGKVIVGDRHSVEFVIPEGTDRSKLHLSHTHVDGGTLSTRHRRKDGSESGDLYVYAQTRAISIDARSGRLIYRITRGANPDYEGLLNAAALAESTIADEEYGVALDEFFAIYERGPISSEDFEELGQMILPRISKRLDSWYTANVSSHGFKYEVIVVD